MLPLQDVTVCTATVHKGAYNNGTLYNGDIKQCNSDNWNIERCGERRCDELWNRAEGGRTGKEELRSWAYPVHKAPI